MEQTEKDCHKILHALNGCVELMTRLIKEKNLDEDAEESLDHILYKSQTLKELIADCLDTQKKDSNG